MTLPETLELFEHWRSSPPDNEMLALLAQAYTTWRPSEVSDDPQQAHQASLEARWKGGAMNAKQLFEAFGGAQGIAIRSDGSLAPAPQIASFPGT